MKITTRQRAINLDETLQAVYFEYIDPTAQSVAIAGTFNDWRPQVTPMVNMGGGRWRKLLVVAPGTYEYTFVVDGRWLEDFRDKPSSYRMQSPLWEGHQPESALPGDGSRAPSGAYQRQSNFRRHSRFV